MEIDEAIQEAERNLMKKCNLEHSTEASIKKGKVVTICSMKGGVGKTTISINLAIAIAKSKLRVAVIDMDLQSGDVAIMLDLKPKITIYDWVKASSEAQESIENYMLNHQSGIEILAAPIRLELADEITNNELKRLISILIKKYDLVIIDTPPQLLDNELIFLENADEILMIVNNDLPTLKNSKIFLDTLKNFGFENKIKVILNRDTRSAGINNENVESIIGKPIFHSLPNDDKLVISSVNKGIPFVVSDKKTKLAKNIYVISNRLLADMQFNQSVKHEKRLFIRKNNK